jgi:hypothetical protein
MPKTSALKSDVEASAAREKREAVQIMKRLTGHQAVRQQSGLVQRLAGDGFTPAHFRGMRFQGGRPIPLTPFIVAFAHAVAPSFAQSDFM